MQRHENQTLYKKAYSIIDKYFQADEADGEITPSIDETNNQYTFTNVNQPHGNINF